MKNIIIDLIQKYKWKMLLQTTFIAINIYLLTYPPKIIGKIVDMLYNLDVNKQNIFNGISYLLGICIILLFIRLVWKYYEVYINRAFEKELKNKLFKRFLKIKIDKIQNIKNGEIMSYFVKDINEIRRVFYRIMSHGVRIIFTFIIATYQMAKGVNIYLTMATMFPILIASYLIVKIRKYIEISFKKSQDKFTDVSEYIQESTDSIRTTKAYSCEGNQVKEFIRKNRTLRQSNNTVDVFSNLLTSCVDICFGLCYAISLIYGSKLVLNNIITVGDLVAFNGYIALFVGPVQWIPQLIAHFKRAQISYKRLEKVFNLEKEKISTRTIDIGQRLSGKIEIKNLNFNYPGCIERTLQDINISLNKGETLGIIGTIGSGKTTLMNILSRLYDVPRGKIFFDDNDINDISIDNLRDNICYITQDNFLFSASLKENINLFRDNYGKEEIENSVKKAIIYDEINRMEKGIDTIIGERGTDLSGGQKQRVVVSRAFLKNSSIIIFDDAFSALDNNTSKQLLDNIKDLTRDKTCIIISNKISDVKNSDKIIVLDSGNIIEDGTHEELIELGGEYYKFLKQQSTETEASFLS